MNITKIHYWTALLLFIVPVASIAQKPIRQNAAELHQAIKKLNVLGSVLYVAAHPDDENQRFISYSANQKLFDVTYLSITRGDGGQNLVGPELRELLGVLRTEELLMARSVDGGKQLFTRANDFGFSKTPEETMRIWDKEAVLSDVVWAIRKTKPDVIVNRFYHDKKYDTHGHHTASGMLAVEAYKLAGQSSAYPEQVPLMGTWQPLRHFYNFSWWFVGGRDKFEKMDKSSFFSLDSGVFLPLKGKSNSEVADEARSMHRCQGFGSILTRGENLEYLDFIQGEKPKTTDLFEGINTTWSRVPGGEPVGRILARVDAAYRSDNPAASVPDLLQAMQLIQALPESHWRNLKLAEIKEVIRGSLGLYLEATAAQPFVTPGDKMEIRLEAINRSTHNVELKQLQLLPNLATIKEPTQLLYNQDKVWQQVISIPADATFTAPYWLQQPFGNGMYTVPDQKLRGLPETPRYLKARWDFVINGIPVTYETDLAYKVEEPAIGEIWRPFEVLPPTLVEFTKLSYLFTTRQQTVQVRVTAERDSVAGMLHIELPAGWSAAQPALAFLLGKKGEQKIFDFLVNAPANASEADFSAYTMVAGRRYDLRLIPIKYEHIPQQSVLLPARAKAARLDLALTAKNIGYYMGAGDDVPNALREMGCNVTLLEDKDLDPAVLKQYDAIMIGIRAYNTRQALALGNEALFEYVKQGGTLINQYNNNYDYTNERIAPLRLKLSRTRVTDEASEVRFLLPDHTVLNTPNKLTARDFEGWIQERGLYFPSEWDAAFEAPLSMNDPGEKAADGALLIAPYGTGKFIYTGISFFRELPAGVPGAYRLLANLISQ